MEEKKDGDPLEFLLKGEKLTKKFETRRGDFTIVFPMPSDLRAIETDVANMLGGHAQNEFSADALADFRAYATLKRVVVGAPDWWDELDSPEQCPDVALIADLYGRYLRFCKETQDSLAKGKYRGDVGVIQHKDASEKVGD